MVVENWCEIMKQRQIGKTKLKIDTLGLGCAPLGGNFVDLNYKQAYLNAIYTSKKTMNTRIEGQKGYKKNDLFDKMSEAEKMYNQYKWIIK